MDEATNLKFPDSQKGSGHQQKPDAQMKWTCTDAGELSAFGAEVTCCAFTGTLLSQLVKMAPSRHFESVESYGK